MLTNEYTLFLYHPNILKKHYNYYNPIGLGLGEISINYLRTCINSYMMLDLLNKEFLRSYMSYFMVFCWIIYRRGLGRRDG